MGQQLYFDNYSPVGDIVVLAVCFVMGILIATSFAAKTKTYSMFINMVIYLVLATLTDMILHDYYAHITNGDYTAIYVLRVVYHALLFSLFLLYIVYFVYILELDKKTKIPVMSLSSVIYFAVLITDIVTTIRGDGFRLNRNGTAISALNIFMFGYIAFAIVIGYLILAYRNRLYKNAIIGIIGTGIVSLMILYNQGKHGQSSFTVATFLFPTLAIMYLLHTNPFDIKTGAVSASSVLDVVHYYYSKGREFCYVSLYLPDFHSEGKPFPGELQKEIRQFPSKHFKKSVLFRINNGHFLFMMPSKNNSDFEERIRMAIDSFNTLFNIYHFDYKIIIGRSIEEISRRNEYLSFIRSIQGGMMLNSFHTVDESDVVSFNKRADILKELEDIHKKNDLDDERVLAYCQPVYNISTRKYDTAEALMRLQLPKPGMVFPDQFIPLAEEYGYIHVLTRIILHKTCDMISKLITEGYEVKRISVNVSVPELRDEGFTRELHDIINASRIPDGKVAIEITESQSESDIMIIKDMIEDLKDSGIKFYLDDFGTGYSNMERIMKLPFDIIKFDRSLVIASESDKRSEQIVGRLAGIFADLNYSVLYEGIENENDEMRCINMSASYLQGYKYSRPVPIEELRKFFTKSA